MVRYPVNSAQNFSQAGYISVPSHSLSPYCCVHALPVVYGAMGTPMAAGARSNIPAPHPTSISVSALAKSRKNHEACIGGALSAVRAQCDYLGVWLLNPMLCDTLGIIVV